jgi:SHS2 domain-containing protein
MIRKVSGGYREISHTADLELLVWGDSLEDLFAQAAAGMYDLLDLIRRDPFPEGDRGELSLEAMDLEGLLILFLEELLFIVTEEYRVCDFSKLIINQPGSLQTHFDSREIESYRRDIKAVTYHNLDIQETGDRFEVRIVFDI